MKLNIQDFEIADRVLDFLIDYREKFPTRDIIRLRLGIKEVKGLGLDTIVDPTFFQIPVHNMNQSSYISLESGNGY